MYIEGAPTKGASAREGGLPSSPIYINLSIYLCIYIFIHPSIYLPIYLAIYLSIYLSIYIHMYIEGAPTKGASAPEGGLPKLGSQPA